MSSAAVVRKGARVAVRDSCLAMARDLMREALGREPEPNHIGTVQRVEGGLAFIEFDQGGVAPFAVADCNVLEEQQAPKDIFDRVMRIGAHTHERCMEGASIEKGHDHHCVFVEEGCDDWWCIVEAARARGVVVSDKEAES